ncbi:MAG: CPBP family intramembrane glutamic endopeptidase [Chloroflexota bacterium]
MNFARGILWNRDQRRPRALWRLSGQLVALLIVMLLMQIVLGGLVVGAVLARGGVSIDQLSDPQVLQRLITQDPRLMLLMQLSLTVAITLSVWFSGRFLDRRPFASFGFNLTRDWWIDLGFGLFQGAALMLVVFLVQLAAGWITITDTFSTRQVGARFLPALLPPLITFLAVGYHEELFSRGYQLQNLAEGLNWRVVGPRGAILISTALTSVLFGLLHAANPNATLVSTLYLIIAGFHLAAGYVLTGELAIPIGQHITWNFFQGNVFGFPVSGSDFTSATFIRIEQGGPDLWTGGAFGPEAGFLGLAAMLFGTLLTVLWVRWRYGEIGLHLPLAQPPEGQQGEE